MTDLAKKTCVPCEGSVAPLSTEKIAEFLADLKGWTIDTRKTCISKPFSFKNFYHTMSFINAVAWIANQENHHPDMQIGYNYCTVTLTTHAIKGLSENDFILATKINGLIAAG